MPKDYYSINNVDFNSIKDSLKDHLRQTDTFKDYNFEGSGLSILLDVLAYNTQYQAFYNNMAINEMYMDTAVATGSVNSMSKMFGYTPSSFTAAFAELDITLSDSAGLGVGSFLPAYTEFTASGGSSTLRFYNLEPIKVTSATAPHIEGMRVYQGTRRTSQFLFDDNAENLAYVIPENNVDITTIVVKVQNSISDDTGYSDNWTKSTNIATLGPTDKVYFIQKNRKDKYEIRFGDGVIGAKPDHGNLVYISYLVTDGLVANGIGAGDTAGNRVFTGSATTFSDIEVSSIAQGGSPPETISSIRENAPLMYQSQNRAVTTTDYKAIIQQEYPSLESINVYGGEEEDPPMYGRVVIAVKPFSGTVITTATKKAIEQTIADSKGVVGVVPLVKDPEYIYVRVNSDVRYNSLATSTGADTLKIVINKLITDYIDSNMEKFDVDLYRSKLQTSIDGSDSAILGNDTTFIMEKRITPNFATATGYSTNFSNALYRPHVGHQSIIDSNTFVYQSDAGVSLTGKLNDKDGKIMIVDSTGKVIKENAGTVDYETGLVTINRLRLTSIEGNVPHIAVRAVPRGADVMASRNNLITYDTTDPTAVIVNCIDQSLSSGSSGRTSY